MKKNKKLFIIVAAAAVVLVGIMLLLIFLPKSEKDPSDAIDKGIDMSVSTNSDGLHQASIKTDKDGKIANNSYGTLIEYKPAQISTIDVENSHGTIKIKSETPKDKDGKTEATVYTLVGYEDFDLQSGTPDAIANDAAALQFSKVASLNKDGKENADFGFDKPKATVNVTYTDKTKSVILVGNDAPQSAGTYVKFGNQDTIYIVASDAVDSFSYNLTKLFSINVNTAAKNDDNNKVSTITLSGSNFSKEIELKPNTNNNNSASYLLTKPSEGFANESESSKIEGAIRGISADSVEMVNPSDSQLNKLGLKTPYAEIKAVYPDITVDIISSKPDSKGNVYFMKKDGKVVYKKASANLPWVTTSYDKLVSEYVLHPQMTKISGLSIDNGDKTYEFSLSSKETTTTDDSGSETTSTTTTVKYGNKEIELSYFSTLFQNLSLIGVTDLSSYKPSTKPVLTATYKYTNGADSDTVRFYTSDTEKYIATVNGKTIGYVYKTYINNLVDQVAKVANNKQIDAFSAQ